MTFLTQAIPDRPLYTLGIGTLITVAGVMCGQLIVGRVSVAFFKRLTAVMIGVSALALLTDILGLLPEVGGS